VRKRVRIQAKPKRVRLNGGTDNGTESLDLIARKVLAASLIYYGLDESVVDDSQFDAWCKKLAKQWHKLDEFRQWQLGSAESIRTSGFHVKCTMATLGGAIAWLNEQGKLKAPVGPSQNWNFSKKRRLHWLTPEFFTWQSVKKLRSKGKPKVKPAKKRKRTRLL